MENQRKEAAKLFMLQWMGKEQTYNPSDFDDIVGGMGGFPVCRTPSWNRSIFFDALGDLVEEKLVHYWLDADGCHWYKVANEDACPASTWVEPEPKQYTEEEKADNAKQTQELWGLIMKSHDELQKQLKIVKDFSDSVAQ